MPIDIHNNDLETASGLLRQYFPKGMSFISIARKEVVDAIRKLNSRSRKCLGFNNINMQCFFR